MENRFKLKVKGMHCISCAQKIERYFAGLDGIKAEVNLILDEILFITNNNWDVHSINESLRVIGYKGSLEADIKKSFSDHLLNIELWSAILIALILMIPHMAKELFHIELWAVPIWLQFMLSGITQFVIGRRFYIGAYRAIKQKLLGMDLLIIMGTTTAFIVSFINWMQHDFINDMGHGQRMYFDISAEVIAFIMIGKVIEKKVQNRSKTALMNKLSAKPQYASLYLSGEVEKIKVSELEIGQVIYIRKGERVPIDGTLVSKFGNFDESMITGESKHVKKFEGEKIIGSTINLSEAIKIRVNTLDQDSVMSKIIQRISTVASEKAPIQKMADKASNVFIPAVIFMASITYFVWQFASMPPIFPSGLNWHQDPDSITNMLAVLVIACPCMLGLATPLAMIVSSTLASNKGIIYNNIEAFEKVKNIDAICFDKTGTITEGRLSILDKDCGEEDFKDIATLELLSTHPIASAFMNWKHDNPFDSKKLVDFKEIEGSGLSGTVGGRDIKIGSREFVKQYCSIPSKKIDIANQALENNEVVIYACIDNKFKTIITLSDSLKKDIIESVNLLHKKDIKIMMITGDNEVTANKVASMVGIKHVRANVKPEEKSIIVHELQSEGKKVAFIGDGINDAIALKKADLSISMGGGSDLAISSSDITLLNNDIVQLINAIDISKKTLLKIKQNLTIAFSYNLIAVFLAAFGYIPPIFAAVAMILESVTVVGNTMRLSKLKLISNQELGSYNGFLN